MTNSKITYTQQGDYLLPDLKLPEQPKVEIGIFGKIGKRKDGFEKPSCLVAGEGFEPTTFGL